MSLSLKRRTTAGAVKTKPRPARAAKGKIGSRFDDFLRAEGTYAQTQAVAIKRVLAWALAEQMKKQNLTKSAMAKRMETSRSQLDRLLDPENADVQLDTLARAAEAVNCELQVQLAGLAGRSRHAK